MMLQLCTMAIVHCDNAVWVPMPIMRPISSYRGWKTADFSHSARTAHGACSPTWEPVFAFGQLDGAINPIFMSHPTKN